MYLTYSLQWLALFLAVFTVGVLVPVALLLRDSVTLLVCYMKSVFRLKENK